MENEVLKDNQYQCANCGNVFEKGRSDEEAMAECIDNFPECDPDESEVICDDCYKKFMEWYKTI